MPLACRLAPLEVANQHVDPCAGSRQPLAGRLSQARARPGDQGDLAGEAAGDRARPGEAAQAIAEPRVARARERSSTAVEEAGDGAGAGPGRFSVHNEGSVQGLYKLTWRVCTS